jgi:hypothetical protein
MVETKQDLRCRIRPVIGNEPPKKKKAAFLSLRSAES